MKKDCENCTHYFIEGNFCGYDAHGCNLGHNLEAVDSPRYKDRGLNCPDYKESIVARVARYFYEKENKDA